MFQLGFVSAILASRSFEEVISFASRHHFSCVELMCWPQGKAERRYAGVTHIDVDTLNQQQVAYIQDYLQKHGIIISALGYYPNPLDPDEEKAGFYINHLLKVIKAASLLGVKVVNTFIGRDQAKTVAENLELLKDRWPAIIQAAEENQVRIAIENCPMLYTTDEWPGGRNLAFSPAMWDRIFEILPSPALGFNYDPSHLVWQQIDYIKPLYTYHDRLFHIHLKDVKIHRDKLEKVGILATPLEYHSPKIPGLGDVKWREFFSALTSAGYRGPLCIEVEDRAFEGSAADVETAILTSRNFLSQFLVLS